MTKLKLNYRGDEILSRRAEPVENLQSQEFQELLKDMKQALVEYEGVGIAAPQVGHTLRTFIMLTRNEPYNPDAEPTAEAVVNPKILSRSEVEVEDWEGCLSVPGYRGLVARPRAIEVEYQTSTGQTEHKVLTDYMARIFLHEYDHLEGVLYLDRMDPGAPLITLEEYEKMFRAEEE